MIKEFSCKDHDEKIPLIIYGAGVYGEYTLKALKKHGIEPMFFCDRVKYGSKYWDTDVLSWNEVNKIPGKKNILIAVGATFEEVYKFLKKFEDLDLYSVYDLIFEETKFDDEELSLQAQDIGYYSRLYKFGQNYEAGNRMFSLDWVITTRCSLKCRDCSNLMQYYKSPQNIDTERLILELDQLLSSIDGIMDLRVIGGEPFMNKDIAQLIKPYKKNDKIENISVYTNATILPKEDQIEVFRDPKVKFEITDYGRLAPNFTKFIDCMKNNKIRHHIVENEWWHKLGRLRNRNMTVDQMKALFKNCYCNDTITLLNGKVYRCAYSAHGRNLNAIPEDPEDQVDIYESSDVVRMKLRQLIHDKEFDHACGYCGGRNNHLETVEPAIQTAKPLDYEQISK